MPAPYSYDLRQKVIDAIELDGMPKTEKPVKFSMSAGTPLISGCKEKHRPETSSLNLITDLAITTKLPTGKNSRLLPKSMATKQQLKWLNFGMTTSLLAPYPEP